MSKPNQVWIVEWLVNDKWVPLEIARRTKASGMRLLKSKRHMFKNERFKPTLYVARKGSK